MLELEADGVCRCSPRNPVGFDQPRPQKYSAAVRSFRPASFRDPPTSLIRPVAAVVVLARLGQLQCVFQGGAKRIEKEIEKVLYIGVVVLA